MFVLACYSKEPSTCILKVPVEVKRPKHLTLGLSWTATKKARKSKKSVCSLPNFTKKAKPSLTLKKPGIKDKHGYDMAIFSQAGGQTWNHNSAVTYPPLRHGTTL